MSSELVVIDDSNYTRYARQAPDGQGMGLVERNFKECPVGYMECAAPFPDKFLIDRAEWRDRLAILKKERARIGLARAAGMNGKPMPSRNQASMGYCWAHSTVSAMLLARAIMNEPYADLSAYHIAATIKDFRNQGGYNSQSVKFAAEKGCASSKTWPQQGMDRSLKNKPEVLAEALRFRIPKWYDLEPGNVDQYVSSKLRNWPSANDYNWWGHSVAGDDIEDFDPNDVTSIVGWIWNSWGDTWSQQGRGQLKGRKLIPDACICIPVTYASAA